MNVTLLLLPCFCYCSDDCFNQCSVELLLCKLVFGDCWLSTQMRTDVSRSIVITSISHRSRWMSLVRRWVQVLLRM